MVGDFPPTPGSGPIAGAPGPTQWSPVFPRPPQARPRTWPPVLLAGLATVVAIAALVVRFMRPTTTKLAMTSTPPAYSAAETSAAQWRLCDTYKLAARSVETDTNGTDKAFARIALANARAIAEAYRTSDALSSFAADAAYRAALDDIVAKDAPVRSACGS